MTVYHLTINTAEWRRYQIEGDHEWYLPALACNACGRTWKSVGESYPMAAVDRLDNLQKQLLQESALSFQDFELLRESLRPLLPAGAPLKPGTTLGAFKGVANGRLPDFSWHESWTMFLREDAWASLNKLGIRFLGLGCPSLKFRSLKGNPHHVLEPAALPEVDLAPESFAATTPLPCSQCKFAGGRVDRWVVDGRAEIPSGLDLCRARNSPATYLASERLVDAIKRLELTGLVINSVSA